MLHCSSIESVAVIRYLLYTVPIVGSFKGEMVKIRGRENAS